MKQLAVVLVLVTLITAISVAQPPPPPGGGRGGPPPPFPGDSTAAERDSLMNVVLKAIAGREQAPAESVFKDIQILKGRPAGSIPRLMNFGFGRSLAVGCYHCHARDDWSKDAKKQRRITRDMFRMTMAINSDYLAKIEGLGDSARVAAGPEGRPVVNCSTCHRGSVNPNREPGPRPAGTRGR